MFLHEHKKECLYSTACELKLLISALLNSIKTEQNLYLLYCFSKVASTSETVYIELIVLLQRNVKVFMDITSYET